MQDDSDLKVKDKKRRFGSAWDDDAMVERLKRLWRSGLTASQVAERLGHGLSRNAVIAKLHRLGLQRRSETSQRRTRKRRAAGNHAEHKKNPRIPKPKLEWEPFVPGPDLVVPAHERKGILDLDDDDCRWPIGDPQSADFTFCNHKAIPGLPYCAHHCRRAYQAKPIILARSEVTKVREPVDA